MSLNPIFITSALFILAGTIGIVLAHWFCRDIERYDDGPQPVHIPWQLPILAAGVIGAFCGSHESIVQNLPYAGTLLIFVAAMMCDSRTGRIPDILTVPALIGVLAYSLIVQRNLDPLIGAGIIFGVFALTAWQTKGLGMGWGDVYLLTLAGAVFGIRVGIFGAILACLLTVIVTGLRRRTKDPVAFAPFVVAAFGLLSTFSL